MDGIEQTSTLAPPAKVPGKKRSTASHDRRKLGFWQPFNEWWRGEFDKTGKRPTADDIIRWYGDQCDTAWGDDRPSLQETRVHAKCLRSVTSVRDYFREYRAKKKGEEDEGDRISDDLPNTARCSQADHNAFSSHSFNSSDMATTSGGAADGSCDAAPVPKRRGRPPKRQGNPGSLDGAIHSFLANKPGGPPPDLQPLPGARRFVRKLRISRAGETDGASVLPGSGPKNRYRPGMEVQVPGEGCMAASAAAAFAAQSQLAGLHLDTSMLLPVCGGLDMAGMTVGPPPAGLGLLSPMRLLLSPKGLMSAQGMLQNGAAMAAAGSFPAAAPQGAGFSFPGVHDIAAGTRRTSGMVPAWDSLLSFANVPSVAQTMELLVVDEPPGASTASHGSGLAGHVAGGSGGAGMFGLSAAAAAALSSRQRPRMLELPEQFMDLDAVTARSPKEGSLPLPCSTARQPGQHSVLPHVGHAAVSHMPVAEAGHLPGRAVMAPIPGEYTGPAAISVHITGPSLGGDLSADKEQRQQHEEEEEQATPGHAAAVASTSQDNLAAVLSLQRMCPGMPVLAPQLLGQQWLSNSPFSAQFTGHAANHPAMPQPMDSLGRQVPVGGAIGLHGLGMLQPVAFNTFPPPMFSATWSAAGDGSNKHQQVSAGILMELESVKGPAMASLVQEHTAAQRQRISISLLESAVWDPPFLRRMSALQGADLLMGPPGQPGRLSLRTIPSSDVAGLDADERWLDQFIRSNGGLDDGHDAIQALLSPNGHKGLGMSLGIRGEHAMPSTTAVGASDTTGCERKRGRSLHRLSSSLLPDWDLAKRSKVSGVSNVMIELDTPKVRALHQLPAAPFNATSTSNGGPGLKQDPSSTRVQGAVAQGTTAAHTAGPSGQQHKGDRATPLDAPAPASAAGASSSLIPGLPEAPKWPNTHLAQLLFGTSGHNNSSSKEGCTADAEQQQLLQQQGAPKAILPSMHEIQRMLR